MAFCRGDIDKATCQTCVERSSVNVKQSCPNKLEAILWDLVCTVRYSDKPMFGLEKETPVITPTSPTRAEEPNLFNQTLTLLLNNLTIKAVTGDSHKKYATGSANVAGYETKDVVAKTAVLMIMIWICRNAKTFGMQS
ncbi:unnamed protein product [Cuscuta europaea]|uniref:Gnk2-homologous domain-containing protein n=1 Tax=Cuscuta europaea TaxID=41803 RepID=A0A9P0YPH8_CUSEU|nr:unnamed protein product [Cuscuta europaea]